ncbi:MAG: hypothetical protein HPY54_04730 [Chthonomonadetes bacterium]|nr:hypothetical protein [Chthonomonadetes bacterium]
MQPVAIALNDHAYLGQAFAAEERFNLLWVSVPSWSDNEGGFTLTLWDSHQRRRRLGAQTFTDIRDNSRVALILPEPVPPGSYYWEISQRTGSTRVGLYAHRLANDSSQPAYLGDQPDARLRFVFGVQYSPYVGRGRRRSWTSRTRQTADARGNLPQWIWYPETPIADNAARFFRKTFDLQKRVRRARVVVTGDDAFTLWLNGREVAKGGQPMLREVDVTRLLRQGRNVLAASVFNAIAPAGLLLELRIEYADGRRETVRSDTSWRCAIQAPPGWQNVGYDDARWARAVEQGDVFSGPWYGTGNIAQYFPYARMQKALEPLEREPAARAEVRVERGAPRLFLNGREVFPLLAWSNDLIEFAPDFTYAGIELFHPHYNLADGWREDGKHDWSGFTNLLLHLLSINPKAYFLIRLGLFVPEWWKTKHPQELIGYALPPDERQGEFGGVRHPSFASEVWQRDTTAVLRQFLRFVERSPLRSRVIGYQIANGIYGEWHYFGARYLPDTSTPMQRACGGVPGVDARLHASFGLFRDPVKEAEVIRYYRRFHEVCADTILHFARVVKQETRGRVLCGAFYTYLIENLWIQEGGHLAPQKVLTSPYIDFVACPYAYQGDVTDGAGNWLGRSRGLAGDGGYRVLLESIKRHGKLYFAEIDPSTCLETQPENMGNGGVGNESLRGSRLILRRDLAQMTAQGNAGWLFDIGPGWYAEREFLEEIRAFVQLGRERVRWNLQSPAQVAAVFQPESFFATAHWKSAPGEGEYDLFGDYFLNRQSRAIHRLGAPVDFLDLADLQKGDTQSYRLLLMVNCFALGDEQVERLRALLAGSGVTVVWFYAPGFVCPEELSVERMSRLTGFSLRLLPEPGRMLVEAGGRTFGLPGTHRPRFVVEDASAEELGRWQDGSGVAMARKQMEGYTSVYVGTAPVPAEILRAIAQEAKVHMWSNQPDIVYACADAVSITAATDGEREIYLPKPMRRWQSQSGGQSSFFRLRMREGETVVFIA